MHSQDLERTSRVSFKQHCGDFANVFKAFIGGNYLSVPFGLLQSGFLLGILGLIFIASLTDHCCHLIVKCKICIVDQIVADFKSATGKSDSDTEVLLLRRRVETTLSYGDIGRICYGRAGLFIVDLSLLLTQFLFCVSYCIFIGNALHKMIASNNGTDTSGYSEQLPSGHSNGHGTLDDESSSPSLEVLVLAAVPLFIGLSFIHSIRQLGMMSSIANLTIFGGFFSILIYMSTGFKLAPDVQWFANWKTFPVFFGQMTSAYEGIGLIIPIESSMDGNRQYFSPFLHASLLLLTCLFAGFGGLGYIRFGGATAQTINLNIYPQNGPLAIVVNVTLIVGIIFTFPLQFFPVAQILEGWIFSGSCRTACCKRRDSVPALDDDEKEEDERQLLSEGPNRPEMMPLPHPTVGQSDIAIWKRNLLRGFLVLLAGGLAVLFRQVFAYLIAFTGAIGSTILAFILPCLFHLKLKGDSMSKWLVAKDVAIIIVSTVGGAVSLYITIQEIIHNLSSAALTL